MRVEDSVIDAEDWSAILQQLDEPSVGVVAEAVAAARDLAVGRSYDVVEDAIADGPLLEDDSGGAFGTVRIRDGAETPGMAEPADGDTRGSASDDDDPQGETDKETVLDAFDHAIRYFSRQLDRELPDIVEPDTPREYYLDRGWTAETIDQKLLGWAPADEYALRDYLMRQGFDKPAIRGTGLFYEDLTPHFQGRYVLPYFDETGRPVYAISRTIDAEAGGHPGDWTGDQKYTKAVKTKEYSYVDEPIYGAETLSVETDRLLVAGGIADAITLHQAGYACVSPVTTVRFKNRHEPRVASLVDEYDIGGVYMMNDAERATIDKTELEADETADRIRDVLTIMQFGEGLRGAFGNAEFLLEEGIDPYLVRLPGGDDNLRKVDPDDFIQDNWSTVETVLASAKHADDHPGYQDWYDRRQDRALENATISAGGASSSDAESSDLFGLSFTDVAPVSVGDRVDNPLGHHGESHGYFVGVEKSGETFGYDHKHNVAYNALSYLLCDAGDRRADEPNGRLDDAEIFSAWKHAKKNRCIPSDDAIPTRALHHVAKSASDWDGELVERETADGNTFDALPAAVYNEALETVANRHGVDPGREPLSDQSEDAEPAAALPLERLDEMDLEDARRFASKRGVEWPTTRDAREKLRSDIFETMRHGDVRLHDAPTALGKSHTIATEPWLMRSDTTGEAPVIQLSETRESRDQAAHASEDAGVSHRRLLGRTEACPVAAGAFDPVVEDEDEDDEDVYEDDQREPEVELTIDGTAASVWFEQMCEGRGLPFSVAHQHLENHNDQDVELPCSDGVECPAISQWDNLPRDEDGEATVDVVHATHGFAHVPSIRNGTNLIMDERPTFTMDLSHGRVREAVSAFLAEAGAPVSTYEQMVTRALEGDNTPNEHAEHAYVRQALDHEPARDWYVEADGAHTLAPALTRAIYYALLPGDEGDQQDTNGRYSATVAHEPPRLDKDASDNDGWNRTYVSVVLDETLTVRLVRNTPSMAGARSVIGLDAHPTVTLWQRNVHPDIRLEPVLSPEKRSLWRRYERGLLTVGVGDATRPFTSGEYFDADGSRAFFDALRSQFGERFRTAITAAAVETDTEQLLDDVGVDDPETMHYGEEKSRGDFGDEDVGALNGCIDPGDDYVLDLLAESGLEATPETTTDDDGGEHRAHGRGFVGPDAEAAAALLASVREQHVAQGGGRYARNADDPDDRAVVFVRSDAAPPGFLDLQVSGVDWSLTEKQRSIVDELRERPHATARELSEAVDVSKQHAYETLERLREAELVSVRAEAGDHGAHLYEALAGLGTGDVVDLTPETTRNPVKGPYTWSLVIRQPTRSGSASVDVSIDTNDVTSTMNGDSSGSDPPG